MSALEEVLREERFEPLQPFGRALSAGPTGARRQSDQAFREEEDHCDPPPAQERAAVVGCYLTDIAVEPVEQGHGWQRLAALPRLFPGLP